MDEAIFLFASLSEESRKQIIHAMTNCFLYGSGHIVYNEETKTFECLHPKQYVLQRIH